MTKTEMRIAIAECCGWTGIFQRMSSGKYLGFLQGTDIKTKRSEEIPNYPEDLNAMAKAENSLSREEELQYRIILQDMFPYSIHAPTMAIRATALQRAEDFLRVKGLWKD